MKAFLNSLLSRKFLLALGACATAVSQHQYDVAAGIAVAWILAEAGVDAVAARNVVVPVVDSVDTHVHAVADAVVADDADPRFV